MLKPIDKEASLKLCSDMSNPYHRIVREFLLTAPTVESEPVHQGKDKPLTNGDRIRAMTDEELASEFAAGICDKVEDCKYDDSKCTVCRLQWLKQEA